MISPIVFVPPVLSALLGAVAIRMVENLQERRSGFAAIHHELIENYWKLEGEIEGIEQNGWPGQYTHVIRLDSIEAVKARSPGVYIRMVKRIDQFPIALNSMEDIRRKQIGSKRAGATIPGEGEDITQNLRELQELLLEVENELNTYATESLVRKLLLKTAIDRPQFDEMSNKKV